MWCVSQLVSLHAAELSPCELACAKIVIWYVIDVKIKLKSCGSIFAINALRMYKMIDKEKADKIIDSYALRFLDEYVETYGVLPDANLVVVWRMGFIDGCKAVSDAMILNSLSKAYDSAQNICQDCGGQCSVCDLNKK